MAAQYHGHGIKRIRADQEHQPHCLFLHYISFCIHPQAMFNRSIARNYVIGEQNGRDEGVPLVASRRPNPTPVGAIVPVQPVDLDLAATLVRETGSTCRLLGNAVRNRHRYANSESIANHVSFLQACALPRSYMAAAVYTLFRSPR